MGTRASCPRRRLEALFPREGWKPSLPAHRVGGWVTPAVLPHHRTYGSVYGGSWHTLELQYRVQYRHQAQSIKAELRHGPVHVRRPGIPPGATLVPRRFPGLLGGEPEPPQVALARARPFPLPPQDAPQLAVNPAIDGLQGRLRVGQLEVSRRSAQHRIKLINGPP